MMPPPTASPIGSALAEPPPMTPGGSAAAEQRCAEHVAHILRCPITKAALRWLSARELASLNTRIAEGALRYRDGVAVARPLRDGLVSLGERFAYALDNGIIVLLSDRAIVLDSAFAERLAAPTLARETRDVQRFYDEFGWTKSTGDEFADQTEFEDPRPVSEEYRHRCHLRVRRFLPPGGRFLLDVGSGPVQYPEYLAYSERFEYRVCVDISHRALREARRKLGHRGIYILGEATNLPIRDGSVDALVCLHTLFHVPQNRQVHALRELHRAIKPGGSGVVVYSWGDHALLTKLPLLRFKSLRPLRRRAAWRLAQLRRLVGGDRSADRSVASHRLYYHAHPRRWWARQDLRFRLEIHVWRSIGGDALKCFVHAWLFGKALLRLAYWLEERFPHLMGRIGQYPLFIIRK